MSTLSMIETLLKEKIGEETRVIAEAHLFHPEAVAFCCDQTDAAHFDGVTKKPLFEALAEDGDLAYRLERSGKVLLFVQIGTNAEGDACNVSSRLEALSMALPCSRTWASFGVAVDGAQKDLRLRR